MKTALVIEGGAMRGIHTVGMMDVFLENNITFPHITGVSAGALNGLSYVSGQHGRARRVITEFSKDKRYFCLSNILFGKSVYGFDFMFGDLCKKYIPFDADAFLSADLKYYFTTTEFKSGETVYFEKNDIKDFSKPAVASGSLPVFSPPVDINGKLYYDGGVSNAVPYEKPFEDGYDRAVILLTRHKGYRKPKVTFLQKQMYSLMFKNNPAFLQKLLTVSERYNKRMEEIERLEQEGKVLAIRPSAAINISRLETDTDKLSALYQRGRQDALSALEQIRAFM